MDPRREQIYRRRKQFPPKRFGGPDCDFEVRAGEPVAIDRSGHRETAMNNDRAWRPSWTSRDWASRWQ